MGADGGATGRGMIQVHPRRIGASVSRWASGGAIVLSGQGVVSGSIWYIVRQCPLGGPGIRLDGG